MIFVTHKLDVTSENVIAVGPWCEMLQYCNEGLKNWKMKFSLAVCLLAFSVLGMTCQLVAT